MGIAIKISTKGQIVLPKDIRDSLHLKAGEMLEVSLRGRQIILEVPEPPRQRITYAEFRRRVPQHVGPSVSIDDMRRAVDQMFAAQGKP